LIGPFNTMYDNLIKVYPDAVKWAQKCIIEKEAMHVVFC